MSTLHIRVEIPKESRNKYESDPQLQRIKLDRFLFSSVVYPTDYGFVPETIAEDGDPLDALVCVSEPTFSRRVIPAKVIALFRMSDEKGLDDKVVCVPCDDPLWNHTEELDDLPAQLCTEIGHFFEIYKQLEASVRVCFVTHIFDLVHGLYSEQADSAVFLRAERQDDERRTFRLIEGEPLPTSFGQDLYRRILSEDEESAGAHVQDRSGEAPAGNRND